MNLRHSLMLLAVVLPLAAQQGAEGKGEAGSAPAKVPATGALANYESLMKAADADLRAKRYEKAAEAAEKAIAAINSAPKPEGMSQSAWESRKQTLLGGAYYAAGSAYAAQNKYPQADKALRAALPGIQNNPQMLPYAYYYLGQADYQLGKLTLNKAQMKAGMEFFQKSAALKSPLQDQAANNVNIIKHELGIP